MKLKILQPVNNGRLLAPGDVMFLPDSEAQPLIEVGAAEAIPSGRDAPIRINISLPDQRGLA